MSDLISQATLSIDVLKSEFDIIAHNLANVNTAGYKRRCNLFSKSLEAQLEGSSPESSEEFVSTTVYDFSQGIMNNTDRPLDFALFGKGFFVIETPDGPLYTRNGSFHLNQAGQLVDPEGRIVAGQAGPIVIPKDVGLSELSVAGDGTISGNDSVIGKFRIVDFGENENLLLPVGLNCFSAPQDTQPLEAANVLVKQGFQEGSNVQMVEELVDMMMVSRLYEANAKFVEAYKSVSNSLLGVAMG